MNTTTFKKQMTPVFKASQKLDVREPKHAIAWLSMYVNQIINEITNDTDWKRVDTYKYEWAMNVVLVNKKHYLVIDCEWNYSNFYGKHPNVEILQKVIPNFAVRVKSKTKYQMHVEFRYDLDAWSSFVIPTLYEKWVLSLSNPMTAMAEKKNAQDQASLLAEHYFPALSLQGLELASEINGIPSLAEFAMLCKNSQRNREIGNSLPSDIILG